MSEADGGASALKALCQQVTALTQAVQRLQESYLQLVGRLQNLTVTPAPTDPRPFSASLASAQECTTSTHTVLVPPPEPWVPNQEKFRPFKNTCLLYQALQPRTFSIETVKVGFIISLLSEEPQVWAHSLLEQKSPIINSVDSFFEAMAKLYEDPQRVATAEAALHMLQQGQRPMEDYTVDFCKWSADTG